jgi:catechol 2,3-dioxygenase-like lactoylglutathione lyase family enzyme
MLRWYARAVLHVADVARALDFYVQGLGFREAWRHADAARLLVAQVERDGCELILSCQWPDAAGHGLVFVSLDPDAFAPTLAGFARDGLAVTDGWWGYDVKIVTDPDGNRLFFPDPASS